VWNGRGIRLRIWHLMVHALFLATGRRRLLRRRGFPVDARLFARYSWLLNRRSGCHRVVDSLMLRLAPNRFRDTRLASHFLYGPGIESDSGGTLDWIHAWAPVKRYLPPIPTKIVVFMVESAHGPAAGNDSRIVKHKLMRCQMIMKVVDINEHKV